MNARTLTLAIVSALALGLGSTALAKGKPGGGGGGGNGGGGGGGGATSEFPLDVTVCTTAQVTGDTVDNPSDPLCDGAPSTNYSHGAGGVGAILRSNCNLNFHVQETGTARSLSVIYDDPRVPIEEHIDPFEPEINSHPRSFEAPDDTPEQLKLGNMSEGEFGVTGGGFNWDVSDARRADWYQNVYGHQCGVYGRNYATEMVAERVAGSGDPNDEPRVRDGYWILEGETTDLCIHRWKQDLEVIPDVALNFRLILSCQDSGNCPDPTGPVQCSP